MAVLSEIPGGPNGDDPNNNPQEEEDNQNENPQEVDENPQEDEEEVENLQEEVENLPILLELPTDLIQRIIAHIPRCYSPSPTLVCRAFRQVITSDELYVTRSLLGFTKPILYALIRCIPYTHPSWFFLCWNNIVLHLRRIRSLPPMFPGAAVVTIGYKIYVMGGSTYNYLVQYQPVSTVIVIDCRFHTWNYLPCMQRPRFRAAAGEFDGRIYVIGGCKKQDADWVEVFNVTTETWATVPSQCPEDASENGEFITYVVMQGRIFTLKLGGCFAYEPVQGLWQSWGVASQLMRYWNSSSSCVVADLLYALDLTCSLGYPIVVYYPNELVWGPVLGAYVLPNFCYNQCKMANFGGKLMIFCSYPGWFHDIWCIVIALETRQGNQIWGVFESISLVFRDVMTMPSIELCRTVMV